MHWYMHRVGQGSCHESGAVCDEMVFSTLEALRTDQNAKHIRGANLSIQENAEAKQMFKVQGHGSATQSTILLELSSFVVVVWMTCYFRRCHINGLAFWVLI